MSQENETQELFPEKEIEVPQHELDDSGYQIANRADWRKNCTQYRSSFKIGTDSIRVTPGWNVRKSFTDIEELAADILQNGLQNPLQGDLDAATGLFYVRDGERRFRAILLINANGGDIDVVEVMPYPSKMTEADKLISNLSTDKKCKYNPIEMADGVMRLKDNYGFTNKEIGDRLGYSRQWVDGMILLAKNKEDAESKINNQGLSATSTVKQIREKTKASDEMSGIIPSAKSQSGDTRIPGDNDLMGGGKDSLDDVKTEEDIFIEEIFKSLNKIESFGNTMDEQSKADLDIHLGAIRYKIEALKTVSETLKNRFKRVSISAINELIKHVDANKVSDGYHTFGELYEHRVSNYVKLCKQIAFTHEVWRSKLHSDGSSFEGWFVLGIHKAKDEQITYHLPIDRWNETDYAETLDQAPEFDGHSSSDVLDRLRLL